MDRSNDLVLIQKTVTYDEIGQQVITETPNSIYCNVKSVGANEFYSGNQVGIRPQFVVTCFLYDYNNETECELDGIRYKIYRTFVKQNEEIELYLAEANGINA